MRGYKKISLLAYLFWGGVAVTSGVFAVSGAARGLERSYGYFSGLFEPVVYEAGKNALTASAAAPQTGNDDGVSQSASRVKQDAYYAIDKDLKKPKVSANAYLVADIDTGTVLLEKNKNSVLPIASIAKIMTAIVSLEEINQEEMAAVPKYVRNVPYNKTGGLKIGQLVKTGDLLYPLLLESSNTAAETIASHYGREKFIKKMNKKAKELGISRTSFADPSGVSPANKSTAQDIFELLSYVKEYKKEILEISRKSGYSADSNNWTNRSLIAGMENYLGGKIGHTTQAKETIAAAFAMPVAYDSSRNIGVILLQSNSREDDTLEVLDYISKNIRYGGNYLARN